jgi:hypothetical protein
MTLKRLISSNSLLFSYLFDSWHPLGAFKYFGAVVCFLCTLGTHAQQPPPSFDQAAGLTQVINAHVGNKPLMSAVLKGTFTAKGVAGENSGTITLAALAQKTSQIELESPNGTQREVRAGSGIFPFRMWTGLDGTQHKASQTDLKLPHPAWFFPSFVLLSGVGAPDYWSSDLGTVTWEGKTVKHISIWQRFPLGQPVATSSGDKETTQTDFYLDPATLLPIAMTFHLNIDPQDPTELILPSASTTGDVLVQVNYSDYRTVQNRQIPFHVQLVQGNSPVMDIQILSVVLDGNDASVAAN